MSEDTRNMDDIPDWAFNMVADGINKLNVTDAAHVMIGCDPREEIHLRDISISTRRREMLHCALNQIDSWIIDNKLLTIERNSHGIPFFSVDDFRSLAIAEGWCWDIPSEEKACQLVEGYRRSKIDATLAALKPHYKETKNTQSGHESAAIEQPSSPIAVAQAPTTPALEEKPLSTRERKSLHRIIGALLELAQAPRINQGNETGVIIELTNKHKRKEGISKRKLEEVFAEAKRILNAD